MRVVQLVGRLVVMTILAVYLMAMSVVCSHKEQARMCSDMRVVVDSALYTFVSGSEIDAYLDKHNQNPRGKMFGAIDLARMEQCLLQHPAVGRAVCYLTSSGVVWVEVEQRKPMFRVMGEQSYFVDESRKRMPLFANNAVYVPIVTGAVTPENLDEICNFVEYLRGDEFWNGQVTQIHISPQGELELTTRVGNHQLLLGPIAHYEKRLKKMKRLYESAFEVVDWNRYKKFDLRYKNQVIGVK